ncbi:hypothetical protein [Isoptericola sp. NPDC057391]|uniref:hypothetical protein n=1 Tax=Isoptericola sp. NPDC057391 TaxID=3346117 RepID=UPI0036295C64
MPPTAVFDVVDLTLRLSVVLLSEVVVEFEDCVVQNAEATRQFLVVPLKGILDRLRHRLPLVNLL